MKRFAQFSIRDLLWLTIVAMLIVGWSADRFSLVPENRRLREENAVLLRENESLGDWESILKRTVSTVPVVGDESPRPEWPTRPELRREIDRWERMFDRPVVIQIDD
jgi:hypothetical protein